MCAVCSCYKCARDGINGYDFPDFLESYGDAFREDEPGDHMTLVWYEDDAYRLQGNETAGCFWEEDGVTHIKVREIEMCVVLESPVLKPHQVVSPTLTQLPIFNAICKRPCRCAIRA